MTTQTYAPGTFCWFELGTRDAAAAKSFYTGLFGWTFDDTPMPGEMGGTYTIFKIGDGDIAGCYQMEGSQFEGVPPHWMTYVTVESVDETAKQAETLGGKVTAPPLDVPGVGRIAVIEDPTGANIAVFKPGDHPGAAQLGPVPGTFGWSELATWDTEAAQGFYTKLFGWGTKASTEGPVAYTEFTAGGQPIGGMMEMTHHPPEVPPHWMPYVMVDDCDAIAHKAGELGGSVMVPPTDIANTGRFCVFADPTGAVLAVIKLDLTHHGA